MQNNNPSDRPASGPLAEHIRALIERSPERSVSFHTFMSECLYNDRYGYYMRDTVKIGKEGDFYTSAWVGSIMGEMLARAVASIVRQRGWDREGFELAEWGGGTGRLAMQLLDALRDGSPDLYRRCTYVMVERSPHHRALQRETLAAHKEAVRFAEPDQWLDEECRRPAIVLSNELLDAFPVYRVRCSQGRFEEIRVTWNESRHSFAETYLPLQEGPVLEYIRREAFPRRENQTFEVNLDAVRWIGKIGSRIGEGCLITIDYGDTRDELYAPHRMNGTLLCYRKHVAHDNPYIHIGEQDITSHVNFSACIRAGAEAGFTSWTLRTQREFLVEEGILGLLQDHDSTDPFGPAARRNRAIRQLLLSDQMSELFKVLIQYKPRQTKKGEL